MQTQVGGVALSHVTDTSGWCAVLYVMGGTSQRAEDVHGEAAMLLDILDLILHSQATAAAVSSTSDPMTSNDNSLRQDHPDVWQHCQSPGSSTNPEQAHQPCSLTESCGESLEWGLKALDAMAKQCLLTGLATQPCTCLLTDYLLDRIVLLSREWPMHVGQAAAQVRANQACWEGIA